MRATQRDLSILHSLDRFGQLDSGHIWLLHFPNQKYKASWDQVAKRLMRDKYITRLGRRMVMGDGAGSGKAVYQLGAEGWRFLGKRGTFRPRFTSVSEHRLKVADAFAELCREEDAGRIKILGYHAEPDTHRRLAGVTVRPDFYVVVRPSDGSPDTAYWLEIDRDKENRPEIERKVRDYVTVLGDWENVKEELGYLPGILFLAETEIGRHNLEGYMRGVTVKLKDYERVKDYFGVDDLQGWASRIL